MTHSEFIELTRDDALVWGVRGFYTPVRIVLGTAGLASVVFAMSIILGTTLAFAVYTVATGHAGYAWWSLGALVSWVFARPDFGFGDVLIRVVLVAVPLAVLGRSSTLAVSGAALVLVTWLLAALVKFVTMRIMQLRLRRSAALFTRLEEAGLFVVERRA